MGDASTTLRDALGEDDFVRVADVRRKVWKSGLFGMASGSLLGFAAARAFNGSAAAAAASKVAKETALAATRARRNREALGALAGGAALAFLGARVGGVNEMASLEDVWRK
jgi:hypothetical protein